MRSSPEDHSWSPWARRLTLRHAWAVLLLIVSCATVPACRIVGSSESATKPLGGQVEPDAAWLRTAIESVDSATALFGLRDSAGVGMDTLKIVPYAAGYLGVYHTLTARGFAVRLATSTDLRLWSFRATLDARASQPSLSALPDGGFVLAVEADNTGAPGPGRRWLRFRYFRDVTDLLSNQPDRSYDAPHTLTAPDRGAEGTPNVYSVSLQPSIDHSHIVVGFHFLTDGVDREAQGVLTDFSTWTSRPDSALDEALTQLGWNGKHGDRDALTVGRSQQVLVEAQDGTDETWRIGMYDPQTQTATKLGINTPGASSSFANPTLALLQLPDQRRGVVITLFMSLTGSAPGEAGELLYYRELPTDETVTRATSR